MSEEEHFYLGVRQFVSLKYNIQQYGKKKFNKYYLFKRKN